MNSGKIIMNWGKKELSPCIFLFQFSIPSILLCTLNYTYFFSLFPFPLSLLYTIKTLICPACTFSFPLRTEVPSEWTLSPVSSLVMATEERENPYEGAGLGTGGKFRKRPFRRSQTTPYDRPPTALRNPNRNNNNNNSNGWFSKLVVDPAHRLITHGAHSLFSSLFRKRLPPPPPHSSGFCSSLVLITTTIIIIGIVWTNWILCPHCCFAVQLSNIIFLSLFLALRSVVVPIQLRSIPWWVGSARG